MGQQEALMLIGVDLKGVIGSAHCSASSSIVASSGVVSSTLL